MNSAHHELLYSGLPTQYLFADPAALSSASAFSSASYFPSLSPASSHSRSELLQRKSLINNYCLKFDTICAKEITHLVDVFVITLMLFMVSVQHDAEHDPYQANYENDNAANQSNGSPRLHAQESSVMQIKNSELFTRKAHGHACNSKHLLLSIHDMKKYA